MDDSWGELPTPNLAPIPFSDLESAIGDPSLRAVRRYDPFWLGMVPGSLRASWENRSLIERMAEAGRSHLSVRNSRGDRDLSTRRVGRSPDALAALAAVGMWRTATTEQIAAITGLTMPGRSSRWSESPLPVRQLWAAGLVDRGRAVASNKYQIPYLLRPSATSRTRRIVTDFDFVDWFGITGGASWRASTGGDVHDTIATELGLRVAEFCDVATVVGEAACQFDAIDPSLPEKLAGAGPDLGVVRPDGLRIMFEVTTHQSMLGIRSKVKRWCEVLTARPFEESGLVVCFLDAMNPDSPSADISRTIQAEIRQAIRSLPEAAHYRLRERFSIARWQWWFPDLGHATIGFEDLTATRPTGQGTSTWEPVSLMDPYDMTFTAADTADLLHIAAHSQLLYGVPHWIRSDAARRYGTINLSDVIAQRAGYADLLDSFDGSEEG